MRDRGWGFVFKWGSKRFGKGFGWWNGWGGGVFVVNSYWGWEVVVVFVVGVVEELGWGGWDGVWGVGFSCFCCEGGEWVCGNVFFRCVSKCVFWFDGLKFVGVDDFGVVWVGVCFKVMMDDRGWCFNSDVFLFDFVVVDGDLYVNFVVDRV